MRSLYTSGVLDVLMNNNININYYTDSKYIGAGAIKDSKGLVGFNYLFTEINNQIPFDEETFYKSNKRFVIGATNCNTGKTEFFEKNEYNIYTMLQASNIL